ncbi:tyrosine-type recombinase/integrase [Emticicia fontis]
MTFNLDIDSRPNKVGLYRIYVRITENRKLVREKTDILINNKKHFKTSAKYGKWVSSQEIGHENINSKLVEILNHYNTQALALDDLYNELNSIRQSINLIENSLIQLKQVISPFESELNKLLSKTSSIKLKADTSYFESFALDHLVRIIHLKDDNKIFLKESSILSAAHELIKDKVNDYIRSKSDLFKYYTESYILNAKKLNKSPGYIRHVNSQANSFLAFAGQEMKLKDISPKTINEYIIHLSDSEKDLRNNTIIDKVQRIGMILQSAADENLIDKNPVEGAKYPSRSPVDRHRLNDLQIKAIENLIIDYNTDKYLFLAQKMFLFSLYNAGIRIGDCIQLRFKNIVDSRLEYQMGKTKLKKSILLSRKSLDIVEQMKTLVPSEPLNTIFGLLRSDQTYYPATDYESKKALSFEDKKRMSSDMDIFAAMIQKKLKDIAVLIKHDKPLTFHISRHSFAEKARRAVKQGKATIFDIKSALGHQKIETTMRYLDSLDIDGLDNAMKAIFED